MTICALIGLSSALAADPFDKVGFESGWKKVSRTAVTGISSDGAQTVVAWAQLGYLISRDGGLTWSRPILPSTGPVGAPGSQPIAVADACVADRGDIFIRTVDGAVRDVSGVTLNPSWGVGAVTSMAAGGDGTVYCEVQQSVIAIHSGRVTGKASGQLIGAFRDAAAVWSGTAAVRLSGAGIATPLSLENADGTAVRASVWSSGPAFGYVCRDEVGAGWRLDSNILTHTGTPQGLRILSLGGITGMHAAGLDFIAVGLAEDKGTLVIIGQDDRGSLRRVSEDVPSGATALCGVDHRDGARFRLLAATPTGIWMYRSKL